MNGLPFAIRDTIQKPPFVRQKNTLSCMLTRKMYWLNFISCTARSEACRHSDGSRDLEVPQFGAGCHCFNVSRTEPLKIG